MTTWKNPIRRAGTFFLLLAFFLSAVPLPVFAAETVVKEGNCGINGGSNLKYKMYKDSATNTNRLVITGSGEMENYDVYAGGDIIAPWHNMSIDSIELPEGLTSIGDRAFDGGHDEITNVRIPTSVTRIGEQAFIQCANLILDSLPEGLTYIGKEAFYQCYNLALTELPDGVTYIGKEAFYQCYNLALTKLPDGVTTIKEGTFQNCSKLALTELPDGVTTIEEYAFYHCENITLTELPEGVNYIPNYAFYHCYKLALTKLPDGVTTIGRRAFSNCTSMRLATLPNATVRLLQNDDGSYGQFINVSWRVPENHYFQNADGSYPTTPSEVTTQLVVTGEKTKHTTKTFPGFTKDSSSLPSMVTVPKKGVPYGNTTIKLDYYYTRNAYGVTWKNTDGSVLRTDASVLYGAKLTPPTITAPAGYTVSWSPAVPDTMPAGDQTFTAVFIPNKDTPYTVEHHQENVTGSGYTLADTETDTGTTDTTATATAKSYTGFTENKTHTDRITSGNIHGDGSLTLKLYYDRNRHNITWRNEDGSVYHISEDVAYGMLIDPPDDPAKRGYTFTGWSPTVPDTMPDKALVFTAEFTPNYYSVTVTAADGGTASADCGNEAATDSTVSVSATADNVHAFIGWTVLSGDVTLADPTAPSTTFVMPPEEVSIRAEFKGQIGVDTDGDGIPDTKIDANDKGEGEDAAAGDGIYTDDNGKKYEEQPKGSGTFVEVTDSFIGVDTDGDGIPDKEINANDKGEGKDTAAGDGIYTDDSGKKYEEQPKGSGIFVEVTDDYIPVDTNGDGKADIEVKANDKGEGKDTTAGDGIYTDDSGKKYEELPKGSGTFVEVTDSFIGVDTDGDGIPDKEINANDKGEGKDTAAGDGIYTDDNGKKYEEQPKGSGIFVEVTDDYIPVDTNGDGKADIEVKANDKGEGKDTAAGDSIYTDDSGKKYKDPDGDGIFIAYKPESKTVSSPFSDIHPGDWYFQDIMDAVAGGYMDGLAGGFRPNAPLTRAQAVNALSKMVGADLTPSAKSPFPDVDEGTTYADAILWGNSTGMAIGYDSGLFGPEDPITREQFALMLYRRYGTAGAAARPQDFTDAAEISPWAAESVWWALAKGYLTGTDRGQLAPQRHITRGEAAVMIMRVMRG